MNTKELNWILERAIDPDKCRFLGVYPRDLIPNVKNFPSCLVVNTDKASDPGSHWLAIYYHDHKSAYLFDSFAIDPSLYNLRLGPYTELANHKQLQGLASDVCGQHCIFYLIHKALGFDSSTQLSTNLATNDLKVAHYVNKLSRKPIQYHVWNHTPHHIIQHSVTRSKINKFGLDRYLLIVNIQKIG